MIYHLSCWPEMSVYVILLKHSCNEVCKETCNFVFQTTKKRQNITECSFRRFVFLILWFKKILHRSPAGVLNRKAFLEVRFIHEPSSTINPVSEPQVVEMLICMKRHKHLSVPGAVMMSLSILMFKTTFAVICGFKFPEQLKQTFCLCLSLSRWRSNCMAIQHSQCLQAFAFAFNPTRAWLSVGPRKLLFLCVWFFFFLFHLFFVICDVFHSFLGKAVLHFIPFWLVLQVTQETCSLVFNTLYDVQYNYDQMAFFQRLECDFILFIYCFFLFLFLYFVTCGVFHSFIWKDIGLHDYDKNRNCPLFTSILRLLLSISRFYLEDLNFCHILSINISKLNNIM